MATSRSEARSARIAHLRGAAADGHELRHAVTYALTAIDEHLAGARIDWRDVRDVLKRAIGEKAGQ